MGFGHRVYRSGDSRVPTMQSYMYKVAKIMKREDIVVIYDTLAKLCLRKKYPSKRRLSMRTTYHMIGIDTDFFTPIFVYGKNYRLVSAYYEQHTANK